MEFKSIDIVGLNVYWLENGAQSQEPSFLIPPSQFSIHLLRRTTPEPLKSESTPRIEVEATLTELNVGVSKSVLRFSHQLVGYLNRHYAPSRRPKQSPAKR